MTGDHPRCNDYLEVDYDLDYWCTLPAGHTGRHRDDGFANDHRGLISEWDPEPTVVTGQVIEP